MTNGNLKHIRESLNFNQQDMAELCGIGRAKRTTYLNYETGKTPVTVNVLQCLSKALSIPLDDLVSEVFQAKYPPGTILNRMAKKLIQSQGVPGPPTDHPAPATA
jgi:transcriptional regulator with XRE-family HTH domain